VIATHLGLTFRERNQQAHILLKLVGCLEVPTVLMGDLNDWLWAGSVRRVLGRVLTRYTNLRTFPAHFPLLKLDRIYVSDMITLVGSYTDGDAGSLSDHLPVIAEIDIPRA
jgi:endonuclease/exonuclease/phosphatase family metal-dependent hydrolase